MRAEDAFEDDLMPPPERRQESMVIEGSAEQQAELFDALALAQGALTDAFKGAQHTTFGNYAELQDYTAVIRPVFSKHGLAYIQAPVLGPDNVHHVYLETIVAKGAARIRTISSAPVPHPSKATNELQCRGIALSYERRYALAAITGMASTDNNGSVGETESVPFTPGQIEELDAAAAAGKDVFIDTRKRLWAEIKDAWATNPDTVAAWKETIRNVNA